MATRATRLNEKNLRLAIDTARIMCVDGGVGLGKSVAVRNNLRYLAPDDTLYFDLPRPFLAPREAERQVAEALGLPEGTPNTDAYIRAALQDRQRVLVFDEAQNLHSLFLEYLRNLWADTTNRTTIVLVGTGIRRRLHRLHAFFSRVNPWQPFSPLLPDEILTVMPHLHAVWAPLSHEDLLWVNESACHGNFRMWAASTDVLTRALEEEKQRGNPDPQFTRELFTRAVQGLTARPPEALPVYRLPEPQAAGAGPEPLSPPAETRGDTAPGDDTPPPASSEN
ncbi:ATP-binding protein [Streptomyces sp. NPDC004111]|uniref:ATP-binding protein n=1 Tax=Streptomyces sp. NPDC004111 TaxID=3364690 RepID=UPI0036C377FE